MKAVPECPILALGHSGSVFVAKYSGAWLKVCEPYVKNPLTLWGV